MILTNLTFQYVSAIPAADILTATPLIRLLVSETLGMHKIEV